MENVEMKSEWRSGKFRRENEEKENVVGDFFMVKSSVEEVEAEEAKKKRKVLMCGEENSEQTKT